jgi:DNA primase
VIAFGGRALAGEEPKYLNSPETPLYVKGQTLYALDVARPAMREKSRAIIVEGYLDCLMAHQHGFGETVAALGTAFTPAQLGLLRRHVDEVIALFDADAAGQKASTRIEEMMNETMDVQKLGWSVARTGDFERSGYFAVRVAVLPAGHDPDSLLRAEGAAALATRIDAAPPLLSFVLDRALGEEDLSTPRGRANAHARVALLLSKVQNAEGSDHVVARGGSTPGHRRHAALDRGAAAPRSEGQRTACRTWRRCDTAGARARPSDAGGARLLALLLHDDEARTKLLPVIEDSDVVHLGLRALLSALRQASGPPEALMHQLDGEAERGLLAALLVDERDWGDAHSQVLELGKRYDIRRRQERVGQLRETITRAQATGDPSPPRLEADLRELQREAEAVRELSVTRPETGANTR